MGGDEMQAILMKRPGRVAMIAALVLALGAVLAFALLSGGARPAQAAARHATKHATHHVAHHARHHARSVRDPAGTTDPDNVQSGDQTTPDTPSAATPGETSGESSETSGEAPGDTQPTGGATDNNFQGECTGDCVQ
jgi:hypothetical protein